MWEDLDTTIKWINMDRPFCQLNMQRIDTALNHLFMLQNIPAAWMSQHVTLKTQLVQLRRNEKTWATKLHCRPNGRAGLTVGWKEFVLGNYLEEFDVCVFKLASQKHEAAILDVSIFRVVPDVAKSMEHPASTNKPSEVGITGKGE